MDQLLVKNLTKYGLSDKEAKTYLALLELEVATTSQIAEQAGINRSSTYVIIESLRKKGLVNKSINKNVRQYVASSPELLLKNTEDDLDRQQKIHQDIENILPNLKALHKDTKTRPKIRVFEGKEGLISAMMETFKSKENLHRIFTTGDNVLQAIEDFLKQWGQRRADLNIMVRGLYVNNQASKKLVGMLNKKYKIVFVSSKDYPFPIDILIWDNKIGYLLIENKKIITTIIESQELTTVMKRMFDATFLEAEQSGREVIKK